VERTEEILIMADLALNDLERQRLARFLAGAFRPARVRPGTWHNLMEGSLDVLEGEELKALSDAYPRVMVLLNLISKLQPYVRGMPIPISRQGDA